MSSSTAAWLVFQSFAGGVVAGIAGLLFAWWHLRRRDNFVFWLTMWLVPFAVLLVLNSAVAFVGPGSATDTVVLWARSQALGASVLLAMPALRSVTGGPRVRWWMVAAGGILTVRAVLFLTTDLVFAHRYADGAPVYGPLITPSFVVPSLIVAVYVFRCVARMPPGRVRRVVVLAAIAGLAVLATAFALNSGPLAELLTALWALPIIAVVVVVGVDRLRAELSRSARQREMRDTLAALANATWFDREPAHILARAEESARNLLEVPEITGRLRRLANGNYFTSFAMPPAVAEDAQAVSFLDDLGSVVSAAARRQELTERLDAAAHTDSLTGLANRRRLDEVLAETWESAGEGRVAVLFCDLDSFKRVNEEFGHPVGDSVLQSSAHALAAAAPPGSTVARFGGDEFVVVVPDAPDDDDVLELAHVIRRAVAESSPGKIRSVSVGVVTAVGTENRETYTLVRDADSAMFEAKRKSLGVRFFDQELRDRALREIDLGRRIARAVRESELEVLFQPIADVRTLEIVAVEALTRWPAGNLPRDGDDWVTAAEESGQIIPIGLSAIRAARKASLRFGLPVGVNVSPRQLAEPDLTAQILDAWGDRDRERLTLEITESALLDDLPLGIGTLAALRAEGVRIALDDFGTGYSSLARLSQLPVDVLKVDRQFASDSSSPRGRAVLRAIIEIAHASGLLVVVEGVETPEQLETIADLGADRVQGYLVGHASTQAPTAVSLPRPSRR